MISFTLRPLYLRGSDPLCRLERRLFRTRDRPGHCTEEKSLSLSGNEVISFSFPEGSLVTKPTELSRSPKLIVEVVSQIS
jgi:hypothetical protein